MGLLGWDAFLDMRSTIFVMHAETEAGSGTNQTQQSQKPQAKQSTAPYGQQQQPQRKTSAAVDGFVDAHLAAEKAQLQLQHQEQLRQSLQLLVQERQQSQEQQQEGSRATSGESVQPVGGRIDCTSSSNDTQAAAMVVGIDGILEQLADLGMGGTEDEILVRGGCVFWKMRIKTNTHAWCSLLRSVTNGVSCFQSFRPFWLLSPSLFPPPTQFVGVQRRTHIMYTASQQVNM